VAARLDDLLEASGELVALAETAEVVTNDDERASQAKPPDPASDGTRIAATGADLADDEITSGRLARRTIAECGLTLNPRTPGSG
jgi:hypothetical protein